jgi:hypothetical protein
VALNDGTFLLCCQNLFEVAEFSRWIRPQTVKTEIVSGGAMARQLHWPFGLKKR